MKLFVCCEGATEKNFSEAILRPYFSKFGLEVEPIICNTGHSGDTVFKGGVSTYPKVRKDLLKLCNYPNCIVTMMFDYYGFPPIMTNGKDKPLCCSLEESLSYDIGKSNFIPYLSLHEFEALLFSDVGVFANYFGS